MATLATLGGFVVLACSLAGGSVFETPVAAMASSRSTRRRKRYMSRVEPVDPGRLHRSCPRDGCESIVFGDSEHALQVALDRHALSCHIASWPGR
ncbi:hypothetical protein SAMN05192558_104266 [Actinokineospora alba]|uniref:Uncharacterized protein n=1 Tax=Actinokineospora alba TaxID=504798 RepID=A0A1H0LSF4_9PSEU|nr:hypothetical protein [Actinokineospora alba]TDP67438.1 hypothetical protein C8E96_2983 [Actinokineospora alba]SDI96627.1 hypothetical protein SAMN05421871_10931 [Actinokineospora alba]SDO71128.1 hypothetical protein SAMN05192558_104266 [Actinokineospora alba]